MQKIKYTLACISYWMKIKNNKVTQRKPLPIDDGSQELINLALRPENNPTKVSEDSKTSISVANKESSAKFSVPEKLKKPHHLILETKRLWADAKANYNYERNIPHLSISVKPINTKRALLLMDTFIKLLEKKYA